MWSSRKRFMELMQEEYESVTEYFNRLKKEATDCKFGTQIDEFVKVKLVTGVRREIYEKVMDSETQTLKELYKLCRDAETKINSKKPDEVLMVRNSNAFERLGPKKPSKWSNKCNKCFSHSHVAIRCPYKDARCHSCGKIGHRRACGKDKRSQSNEGNARPRRNDVNQVDSEDGSSSSMHSMAQAGTSYNVNMVKAKESVRENLPISLKISIESREYELESREYERIRV